MGSCDQQSASPLRRGVIGELFWVIPDPVLVVTDEVVEALNPAAERLFDVSPDRGDERLLLEDVCGDCADGVRMVLESGEAGLVRSEARTPLHLDVKVERLDAQRSVILLRDVTTEQRYVSGLVRLNEIAREVLNQPLLDVVLQRIVDGAKEITGAAFSALLILKEGSDAEVAKFVYNAPRALFPSRLPRAVGLLAVPIQTRRAANIADIRGHPAGVGIPVEHHPPIGPLLAVPIVAGEDVLGELAVANPPGNRAFGQLDEQMLTELGLHAAEAVRVAGARVLKEESERTRQTLIDVIRHDMATPLAVARGCLDHLAQKESSSDDQHADLFQALDRAVAGLERLSSNLRSDARLENPAADEQFVEISTSELIAELEGDLVDFGRQRKVDVVFHLEPDAPAVFRGSHLLARQAIENLITNAVKHSSRESAVVVTCRREGSGVRFDVRDTGPGIAATAQEDLFERFTSTKRAPGGVTGLGIGLSIVRRVAHLHGGTVGVASQPGDGSTFWITLPVDPPVGSDRKGL